MKKMRYTKLWNSPTFEMIIEEKWESFELKDLDKISICMSYILRISFIFRWSSVSDPCRLFQLKEH